MKNELYKWLSPVLTYLICIVGVIAFIHDFGDKMTHATNQFWHFLYEFEWYLYLILIFEFANILLGKFLYRYKESGIKLNLAFLPMVFGVVVNIACGFPIYKMGQSLTNGLNVYLIFVSINILLLMVLSTIFRYNDNWFFSNRPNITLKSRLSI